MNANNYKSLDQYDYCRKLFKKRVVITVLVFLILHTFPIPFILFLHNGFGLLYFVTGIADFLICAFVGVAISEGGTEFIFYIGDDSLQAKYKSKQAYINLLDKAIQGETQ
jgi:hypothetical protein